MISVSLVNAAMNCCFRFYLAYGYMLVFMGIGFVSGAPIAGKPTKHLSV